MSEPVKNKSPSASSASLAKEKLGSSSGHASSLVEAGKGATGGAVVLTPEQERLARKVFVKYDWLIVLPVLTMFYLLSFIDRVNIGNARVAGLQTDLGLSNYQYSIALTMTYVPYIAIELPANLILKRVGANIMLPTLVVAWGLVTTLQGLVTSYEGLLAARFFLGLAEGGLLPGILLVMSTFYKRHQLQLRTALLFTATSLAGAFSGLLATAILNLEGKQGHRGWQWIFILEGLMTVVFGLVSYFILPRTPTSSRWLSEEEKEAISLALAQDWTPDAEDEPFSWSQVIAAFKTPHVLILAIVFFFSGNVLFGLAFFAPTIVRAMGFSPIRTQLLSVPPYAAAFVFSVGIAVLSDRYKNRGFVLMLTGVIAGAGYILFMRAETVSASYASIFLQTIGAFTSAPTVSAWNVNNVQPHFKRSTAIAIGFVMSNCGGILSTWIFTDPPKFKTATRINLSFAIGMTALAIVNRLWLQSQNNKKAAEREARDARGEVVDHEERRRLGDDHPDFIYTL